MPGDYVAQELVSPGERLVGEPGPPRALKFDVRNYVYAGQVQFVTARLYQGQTTNARTPGGRLRPRVHDCSGGSHRLRPREGLSLTVDLGRHAR